MKLELERDFAENTTLHGISRVFQSAGVVLKFLWSIIFLSAFGLFIWQFTDRITAYLKFDVNTLVEVEEKVSLPFPAVSFCNYNKFSSSQIPETYGKVLDYVLWTDMFGENFISDLPDIEIDFNEFAEQAGFSLEHSLVSCTWKGKVNSCSAANFTAFVNPEYGICYRFGGNDFRFSHELFQNLPGSRGGLSILINIDQDFYTAKNINNQGRYEAGLKFVLHDKNDLSFHFVDTLGLAVPPGFHTFVHIKQKTYELLPEPWGKCKKTGMIDGIYDENNKVTCLLKCRLDFIIEKCHCRPLGYPPIGEIPAPLCTPKSLNCVESYSQEYGHHAENRKCVCPPPCTETSLQSTLSMTLFPGDQFIADIQEDFPYLFGNKTDVDISDQIRKNFVYLDIFFDELSETKIKQVPAMTWSALLSDLGGQMGLFLGMSAITAAEVMEYLIRKIYRLFRRDSNRIIDISNV